MEKNIGKQGIILIVPLLIFSLLILVFFSPARAGSLMVHADPPGAQVLVDDNFLGTTDNNGDLFFEDLAKGPHKITVKKDGYESYQKEITATDLTININATLNQEAGGESKEAGKGSLFKKFAIYLGIFFLFALLIFGTLILVLKKRCKPKQTAETIPSEAIPSETLPSPPTSEIPTPSQTPDLPELKAPPKEMLTPPPSQATDFGNYMLISKIKEGGMARIYKAKHKSKEGFYVLKIPYEQQLSDPANKERFLQEAKLRESLSHPNIVKIWDAGEVRGLPFFAMEHVEGFNVREVLHNLEFLSEKQAVTVIYKTCEALDYAHNKKVLHKDLKPENILVSPLANRDEEVKVVKIIDFGLHQEIAGRTGTPPYMSPEQARKEELSPLTDLFAVGVIFYELLTGIKLFSAANQEETIHTIAQTDEVVLPKPVNPILQRIISSLLKKDKSLRLSSASMVINALDAFRFHYH